MRVNFIHSNQQFQNQLKQLRNIISVSEGSLSLDQIVKALKIRSEDEFLDFLGEIHLGGIKIDWTQRVVTFQQDDLSLEIDALLNSYEDWGKSKGGKIEGDLFVPQARAVDIFQPQKE